MFVQKTYIQVFSIEETGANVRSIFYWVTRVIHEMIMLSSALCAWAHIVSLLRIFVSLASYCLWSIIEYEILYRLILFSPSVLYQIVNHLLMQTRCADRLVQKWWKYRTRKYMWRQFMLVLIVSHASRLLDLSNWL